MWTFLYVLSVCIYVSVCKPSYRDFIPNGYGVPNPCNSPRIWAAVGHFHPDHHTTVKNQFGIDFSGYALMWKESLCRKDSDGDGRTNGEELGDPHCTWSEGETPLNLASGNPGICEPVGSAKCVNRQNFRCDCMDNCLGLKP